jgi:hypothetical protein
MKRRKLKDASVVGAIAGYDGGGLGVTNDLDPKQTKKRNKTRKKNNSQGKMNTQPKEFNVLENGNKKIRRVKKSVVENMVKEELFDLIIEQGKPDQVMDLFDNVGKMLSLSLQYCRMFMTDGMKMHDDALDFNIKRAKSELNRVRDLTQDMDQILVKTYHKHKKQKQAEEQMATKQAEMEALQTERVNPERIYPGVRVKLLRGSAKGQTGVVVDYEEDEHDQVDVKVNGGRIVYVGVDDIQLAESKKNINEAEKLRTIRFMVNDNLRSKFKNNFEKIGNYIANKVNGKFLKIVGPGKYKSDPDGWDMFKNFVIVATEMDIKTAEQKAKGADPHEVDYIRRPKNFNESKKTWSSING